jgi:hypothetical protein
MQVIVAQRPLADGAHPALARREEHSAFVALPPERRLAEERWHYTIARVWEPLHVPPGLSSTGAPICAASTHTIRM